MNEKLKQKLELLGEPALPESLSAEALFRRMDSGELVLPDDPPAPKVIPWAKVLRRGVPIAACLAVVVFLAQGGLWRMGSSGGANLTGNAAAPQASAATDQAVPLEQYSFDADGEAPEPDPGPRAIAIEDGAEEEAAAEDDTDNTLANGEMSRQENGEEKSAETAADEDFDNANPDSGPVVNPDIGPADYDREQTQQFDFAPLLEAIGDRLYLQDEALTGLTPFLTSYGPMYTMTPDSPDPFNGWFYFENAEGKVAALRVVHCSINPEPDGGYSLTLLSVEEWSREERETWLPGKYVEWADELK